ncbi:hypothetical protein V490_09253, partial [Pseudogymnoascus sp. VKM F-3557]
HRTITVFTPGKSSFEAQLEEYHHARTPTPPGPNPKPNSRRGHLTLKITTMRFPPPSILLSLLSALPVALCAPADTPATTTLLSVTPTPSSTFPLQTHNTSIYPSLSHRGESDGSDAAQTEPLNSDPSQTLTNFVAAPTEADGEAQHWYIVTYYSCVLVLPALWSFLSTLVLLHFGFPRFSDERSEEKMP